MRSGRQNKYVVAAIFILMEVAAISMLRRNSAEKAAWMNRASMRTIGFLWGSAETVRNYFSLGKQNADLYEENERLQRELSEYRDSTSSFLERKYSLRTGDGDFNRIPARVIKLSRNTTHNYIILNKGREDGVKPYSGIISSKGVIGVINSVGKHYSYGQTLINSHLKIGAMLSDGNVCAPMAWDGIHNDRAVISDLPPKCNAAPGDTIYTSGYSLLFASGIPLGTLGDSRIVNGSTKEIEVFLFQDFSAVRYVTILVNRNAEEIEEIERQEEGR